VALHRRTVLVDSCLASQLISAWRAASDLHGWNVGRYIIMPDHVHFFCQPQSLDTVDLSEFIGAWKSWTTHQSQLLGCGPRLWQREFFDHLLRNSESYEEKWEYVRANPVRAGLVSRAEDWPWQGEIEVLCRD
jgi:REP element-mobilizing transposase RayT